MTDTALRLARRPLNAFVFCALCLVVVLAWDVGYAFTHPDTTSFWLVLVAVPMGLCFVTGYVAGQWRRDRRDYAVLGTALWCLFAPFVAILPFLALMCFAFDQCIGD